MKSSSKSQTPDGWIRAGQAAKLIGRDPETIGRLGRKGVIRRLYTPGLRPLYNLEDVRKLAPTALASGIDGQ